MKSIDPELLSPRLLAGDAAVEEEHVCLHALRATSSCRLQKGSRVYMSRSCGRCQRRGSPAPPENNHIIRHHHRRTAVESSAASEHSAQNSTVCCWLSPKNRRKMVSDSCWSSPSSPITVILDFSPSSGLVGTISKSRA
jgi:hypothetical protein